MGNGNVEGKLPDGTIGVIPGIKLNPDGKGYTIMVNGVPVVIYADKVNITDDGINIEGYSRDSANGEFNEIVKSPAQLWAEQNGGGFDEINGVAWDKITGLVTWEKNLKGEWVNYPDGMVSIPPGPGNESMPSRLVPYYRSFNMAIKANANMLPWGEKPNMYREKQNSANAKVSNIYYMPIFNNGTWKYSIGDSIFLSDSRDPLQKAYVNIYDIQLPGGRIVLGVNFESDATDHYVHDFFVFGNADENKDTYAELSRIHTCVQNNSKAGDLAELCKSDVIKMVAPAK